MNCSNWLIVIGNSSLPSPTHRSTPAGCCVASSTKYRCQASKMLSMTLKYSQPTSVIGMNQVCPSRLRLNWYGPKSEALGAPGARSPQSTSGRPSWTFVMPRRYQSRTLS